MSIMKSEILNCFGPVSASEFFPVVNSAMGIKAESELNGISSEMEQYTQLIGKSFLITKGDNLSDDKEKEQKRKRAKRANEIFRTISKSAGLHPFFFDKFLVWSDYVDGKLNEEEFMETVREEVNIKAASLKN